METWGAFANAASWLLILAGAAGAAYVLWERPTKRWGLWQAILVAGGCLLLLKWLHLCLLLQWGSEMLLRQEGEMPPQGVASALLDVAYTLLSLLVCLLGIRYLWQCLRGKRERSPLRMILVGALTWLSLTHVAELALKGVVYGLDAH